VLVLAIVSIERRRTNDKGSVRGSLQAKFGTIPNMPLYIE
jgi:hypothetical protein